MTGLENMQFCAALLVLAVALFDAFAAVVRS
jgi:hypothetical protein